MITQEKIDKYKYMNKASNGIIMIKPEEDLKKHEDNKQYRSLEDVLYNIDDIADNCEIIGIGVDPYSGEVFNTDALAYPHLVEVLKYIEKKYINIPVVISATVDSILNYEQTYYNLSLNIDLYNIDNLNELKNKILPNINCFYIPYPQNSQINFDELDLLYPNIYYFYCCEKRNKYEYLGYIDEMNKRNNIIFSQLENVYKDVYCKIIKINNK
ncbi:MAG: hypothetical protein E7167_01525 [Firmicutes bacterium]|nr:hypothetical protein [Bacillota bacterium]